MVRNNNKTPVPSTPSDWSISPDGSLRLVVLYEHSSLVNEGLTTDEPFIMWLLLSNTWTISFIYTCNGQNELFDLYNHTLMFDNLATFVGSLPGWTYHWLYLDEIHP